MPTPETKRPCQLVHRTPMQYVGVFLAQSATSTELTQKRKMKPGSNSRTDQSETLHHHQLQRLHGHSRTNRLGCTDSRHIILEIIPGFSESFPYSIRLILWRPTMAAQKGETEMTTTRIERNDVHRPSTINPADYEYVGQEVMKIYGMFDCMAMQMERARIKAHMDRTGGTYSGHEHGGNCMVCGSVNAVYTVLFYHKPSNTYVRVGQDCAGKLDMGDEKAFRVFRDAVIAAREHHAGKVKAQGVLENAGLSKAWEIYSLEADHHQHFEERTVADIVGKLVKYGSISQKQQDFLSNLLRQIEERPAKQAKREAEAAAAKDVPEGRQTLLVEVLKTEVRDGAFGSSLKMLVKSVKDGFKLWGTCPSSCSNAERGDLMELTATLKKSDRDPKFGFFSRPYGRLRPSPTQNHASVRSIAARPKTLLVEAPT